MNAKQLENVSKNTGRGAGQRVWWLGASLAMIAALAVALAIHYAPAPNATEPAVRAQTVPSAADQGVMNYLRAHGAGTTGQTVPSAADQGVMNYLRAHGAGTTGQTVPSAADQGVMGYLRAHGFGATSQSVPSAADQGVMDYLRAHGVGQSVQAQTALDAPAQDEAAYLRSHPGRHGAPYAIPESVTTDQLYVLAGANSNDAPPLCARRRGAGCDGPGVRARP
jgi:hypothetical protein